jgi:hypothetical protein
MSASFAMTVLMAAACSRLRTAIDTRASGGKAVSEMESAALPLADRYQIARDADSSITTIDHLY